MSTQSGGIIVKPFSRVLAAVDFSRPARAAFEYAIALSKQHRAELVVVQAVPRNEALSWHAPQRRALIRQLRHRATEAQVAFTSRIQQGDAAEIILLHARTLLPDIIVAGTHQRRGFDRLRTASVAERLAAAAAIPVLLVPKDWPAIVTRSFSHIAVAVDFDNSSDSAIEHAVSLATGPTDRLTLLHVVAGLGAAEAPDPYRLGIVEYQDQLMLDDRFAIAREAQARLQRTFAAHRRPAATIDTRVLFGDVTTEIGRAVGSIGADLLVVGVPTRSIVSRLFGTTAARLLRVTPVPMLAVPEARSARADEAAASLQRAS